jgi:A/G-specific adenine glycosylase
VSPASGARGRPRAAAARDATRASVTPGAARAVARALLDWYDEHRRDLPWRRTRDPYAIWVSEMMLQQTQVATVLGYYARWLDRFPTVSALAAAREDDVLHAWQGLGYYSRARNLWRGAQAVVSEHGGAVPRTVDALRALPGIGPYSAGAIASIAHGERAAIVDGNVIRVLCRLFGLRGDPSRAPLKNDLWALAGALVPEDRPGDFNQAMMELGATVCLPRGARCAACPLAKRCVAHQGGTVDELPELAKRTAAVAVARAAGLVTRKGRVLVVQVRDSASRWAGMWQFPNTDVARGETPERAACRAVHDAVGLAARAPRLAVTVRHSVTHHRITLDVFECDAAHGAPRALGCKAFAWAKLEELETLAMPAAHRRIASSLRARPEPRSVRNR